MGELTIGKEQQVAYSQKEDAYVITSRDWKRIKKQISKLRFPSVVWSNIGWTTLGIGLSCLASWKSTNENVVFLVIGVCALCVAICSFFASNSERKHYDGAVDDLNEVVSEIEGVIITDNE